MTFDSNENIFKEINALREKKSHSPSDGSQVLKSDETVFKSSVKRLLKSEKEIKVFHSLVMAINIDWDLRGCAKENTYWQQICSKLEAIEYMPLTAQNFQDIFYKWVHFYAQVFQVYYSL